MDSRAVKSFFGVTGSVSIGVCEIIFLRTCETLSGSSESDE